MPSIDLDGTTIAYRDSGGDGSTIVFVHAFPFDSRMWDPQFETLGERYRCIAVDLSGFGGSTVPDDATEYSMDRWAEELHEVVERLGLERIVLVGLSMGGYISFAFLRKHGDVVGGLVLADTRAEADTDEIIERRNGQQEMVRAGRRDQLIDALADVLVSETTRERKPDVYERVRALMDNRPAGFIGGLEAIKNRPDSTGDLTSITVPTLVVVGEQDAITPPDAARRMHEHIGGSRLVVVPGAGHISNVEASEAFNGALADFLSDLER